MLGCLTLLETFFEELLEKPAEKVCLPVLEGNETSTAVRATAPSWCCLFHWFGRVLVSSLLSAISFCRFFHQSDLPHLQYASIPALLTRHPVLPLLPVCKPLSHKSTYQIWFPFSWVAPSPHLTPVLFYFNQTSSTLSSFSNWSPVYPFNSCFPFPFTCWFFLYLFLLLFTFRPRFTRLLNQVFFDPSYCSAFHPSAFVADQMPSPFRNHGY